MVKKLKYLIFILLFIFITNVNAQTYTANFNSFIDTAETLTSNIQCNNSQCIVYNVPFYNYPMDFEWGTTNSPTCSSTAIVSGSLYADNTNFGINNNDFSWTRVYIVPTGNSNTKVPCSFQVSENGTSFVCTSTSLSSNFKIGFSFNNNFGGQTSFNSVISRSIDINCDTSTGQIIDNQNANTQNIINNNNSNTQNIINNNTQNTQDIINNNAENTQDIIDNQNSNTQQEIESQKVCDTYNLDNNALNSPGFLNSSGVVVTNMGGNYTSNYYPIIKGETYSLSLNYNSFSPSYCLYDSSKTLISCTPYNNNRNFSIIPSVDGFIRYSGSKSNGITTFTGKYCNNGNQALNDSVNNLNDTLNSTDTPDTANELSDLDSSLISDTPITDLITLPITLLNSYISGFNSSCSPYNLGNLLGTDLILPCINLQQRLGSNLWTVIDSLFSIFMIYNIAMLFITAFDGFTSLRDDYESLYQPKHADTGYQPKHGGGN